MMFYGTISGAQDYFSTKLHAGLWDETSLDDRAKALHEGTRIIDNLSYAGYKHAAWLALQSIDNPDCPSDEDTKTVNDAGETQELEFPRGSDEVVPVDIENANYEIAFALLSGRNPQDDFEDLATISQGYSAIRRTRDRSYAQEHLLAGVPSLLAWGYLRPYLRDDNAMRVNRV